MKESPTIIELDKYEKGILINALNELRNKLIRANEETYSVDLLILKVLDAPEKKRCFPSSQLVADR